MSARAAAAASSGERPLTVMIVYSSGDLGDVGRHAVAAALEYPESIIGQVRVLSCNFDSLQQSHWKCGCDERHSLSSTDFNRLELIPIDLATATSLGQHFSGVDAVISCLGNRQPFHDDCVAKTGTIKIVNAITSLDTPPALVMLSSVGIAEDWPPMEWCREGQRLQGFFRTICWRQYQDLTGAELAVHQGAQTCPAWNFLIVRSTLLSETEKPETEWYIQQTKHKDHPRAELAKMDCARFMTQEVVRPSMRRRAVVVGGLPATCGIMGPPLSRMPVQQQQQMKE